jgi:hypothetical protein
LQVLQTQLQGSDSEWTLEDKFPDFLKDNINRYLKGLAGANSI